MKGMHDYEQRPDYTVGEEIANSITHGVGVLLGVAGLVLLVTLAAIYGDAWHVVSFSIYGVTLVITFLASTLYHAIQQPRAKHVFNVLDHASIYLLIAGTYTPILLISMRGPWGWTMFGVIWGSAFIGVVFKSLFINRFRMLSVAMYVLMGWTCLIAFRPMLRSLGAPGVFWIAIGGLFYTVGVIFYLWKRLPYGHALWHLFVLAGSASHFFAIIRYVGYQ